MKNMPLKRNRAGRGERRHMGLDPVQLQAVAGLFSVLAEGSRLRILQILQDGPRSVGELVAMTGFKQANVSKQIGILEGAGIVTRRQEGNRVICSIALPLVLELCEIVCHGIARQAADRAEALASMG